jgi:hypothetical protein
MNPGEFVRWNGRSVRALMIKCRYQDGYEAIIGPDSPDYALAVAALQALVLPKPTVPLAGVHPGVGLRWCGEEEAFGWVGAGTSRQYLYRFRDGQVEYLSECGEWIHFGVDMDAIFEASRRYERERGCAYVSDKPWTHQS